jgi:hypothetical protein
MPIEIKELIVKVQIESTAGSGEVTEDRLNEKLQILKSQIVNQCVEKVMEKLKEKNER